MKLKLRRNPTRDADTLTWTSVAQSARDRSRSPRSTVPQRAADVPADASRRITQDPPATSQLWLAAQTRSSSDHISRRVAEPCVVYPGRDFSGGRSDFDDLNDRISITELEGHFSVAFKATWNKLYLCSRILDIGSGPKDSNILISNNETTSKVQFDVFQGSALAGRYLT